MKYKTQAANLLRYYLEFGMSAAGNRWNSDNTTEVNELIDLIADEAVARVQALQPQRDPDKPTGPTPEYLRELEAEVLQMKAERDALVATITEIAGRVDTSRIAIHEEEECYLLDWQDYVALRKIAAAKGDK